MKIIDFHCHPGYDFYRQVHGIQIDNELFSLTCLNAG